MEEGLKFRYKAQFIMVSGKIILKKEMASELSQMVTSTKNIGKIAKTKARAFYYLPKTASWKETKTKILTDHFY